jgi:hypothetical protein
MGRIAESLQGGLLKAPASNRGATTDSTILDPNAKGLESLLGESIDHVLGDLLGRKAREAIYDYMGRHYSVFREDIPRNTEKFFAVTEAIFGKGSKTIAKCVTKRLWELLGWKFVEIQGFEFSDYMEAAKARNARELVEKAKASMQKTQP